MRVGDSLIERISSAINEVQYVLGIISSNSISSRWVKEELEQALHLQILGQPIKVMPILLDDCDIPVFLRNKVFADFRFHENYSESLNKLLESMNIETWNDLHTRGKGYSDTEVLERILLPSFFEGQNLFPYDLLRLQQTINILECLAKIRTTKFDPFYEGQILDAACLNQMIVPIKTLLEVHDLPALFQFYPVSDGLVLSPEHFNELVETINQIIKKRLSLGNRN